MEFANRVRKATVSDIPLLVELMKDFYAEAGFDLDEREAAASFSDLLSQAALGSAWIAFAGVKTIGHAVLTVRFTMEHGGLSGYIDDLFVAPGYRRHGVASQLLGELEKECIARGCKALIVEVGKDNLAGLKTYEKLAMTLVNDGRVLYRRALEDRRAT